MSAELGFFLDDLLSEYPYVWVFVIILGISVIPILTPPSWMVVASTFALDPSLEPVLLSLIGASAATAGRVILQRFSSAAGRKAIRSQHRKASLERLQNYLQKTRYGYFLGTMIFALIPLPSNMLFISYGLMKARSIGIIAGFWVGRFIVYMIMIPVSGYIFRPLADIAGDNLWAVVLTDVLGVAMTVFVLVIDWDKAIFERKLVFLRPRIHR